jgi:hypothetical protein
VGTAGEVVEAHAFNRRRLVTALVVGAPDGHEVEPVRPERITVAGIALGVLLIAGAGAISLLAGSAETGSHEPPLTPASTSVSSSTRTP